MIMAIHLIGTLIMAIRLIGVQLHLLIQILWEEIVLGFFIWVDIDVRVNDTRRFVVVASSALSITLISKYVLYSYFFGVVSVFVVVLDGGFLALLLEVKHLRQLLVLILRKELPNMLMADPVPVDLRAVCWITYKGFQFLKYSLSLFDIWKVLCNQFSNNIELLLCFLIFWPEN